MPIRPPCGKRLALPPPGGSRRRWAPAAAQMKCVLRGSLPGLARGRRPPPRAQAALQSRPLGSARPPSPRRRLRLRRARPRLALPPQLRRGAGRSGCSDPERGKRRAAGSASGGGCRGGRRRGGRGAGAGGGPLLLPRGQLASAGRLEAPRPRGRGRPPGSLRASRRELRPGRGEDRTGHLHPPGGGGLRAREAATARVSEPSSRPRHPAAGADMGARGCARGRGTRKVC